jgi:hypothetical protein
MLLNDKVPYQDCYNLNRLLDSKLNQLEKRNRLINYVKNNNEEYQKYMTEQNKIANVKWTK